MAVTTNVPGLTYTDRGYVAPSEAEVLAGVQTDIDQAFGGGVNPVLTTPQGQIATSTTAIIGNTNDSIVNLFNMFDPAYASGRMQDAIARIYFISRNPAQPTTVSCVCTGAPGVPIPAGSLAKATDDNVYAATEGGVIGIGGTVTLEFACTVNGPIACPADSLNKIYRAIPGWDTINNPGDGALGNEVESRVQFEARRAESVAKNARGSLPSVLGSVLDVSNVLDAFVTENNGASPATIRGVSVPAHSLYVSVSGGTDEDVAKAIWTKKAPGCGYGGNTTVDVTDDNSGYTPPLPVYPVTFERPASLPIMFAVLLQDSLQVPSDAVTQVQDAIIAAFAGADGGTRARIASNIYASRYYGPVASLGSWTTVISLQVGSRNDPSATFTASIAGTAMTVTGSPTGTIAIGQTISDVAEDIIAGTTIVSGAGLNWVVSNAQTISSRAMISAVADNQVVEVNADQVPTINRNNIKVTLT